MALASHSSFAQKEGCIMTDYEMLSIVLMIITLVASLIVTKSK